MKCTLILFLIFLTIGFGGLNAAAGVENGGDKEEKAYLPYVELPSEVYQLLKNSKWTQAVDKLIYLYEKPGSDTNLKFYIAFCYEHIADNAIKEKRYRDGIDLLNNALEYVDDQPRIYFGQGVCYFTLAQYEDAEEAFSNVVRLLPDHFLAHRMLGEINYLNNNLDEAREHWETALKLKPDDSYTKKRLAGLKKFDKVAENFETEAGMMFSVSFNGKEKPELRELVLGMLEKISSHVGNELGLYPKRQIPVILLTNRAFFDITGSPEWAGGVYEGQIKVPVDKYDASLLRIVLAHEYVHAVIFDRLTFRCPWWLNEGLAQYLSLDQVGNKKKLDLAAKYISEGEVPSLGELPGNMLTGGGQQVQVAYALALSAVQYFVDQFGISGLQLVFDFMADGKGFANVIGEITGYSFKEFQTSWKEATSGK